MIETSEISNRKGIKFLLLGGILIALTFMLLGYRWAYNPPGNFPVNDAITVPRGLSASAVADLMKERQVVRSAALLYFKLILSHDPQSVQAGTYIFDTPLNVNEVADRLTTSGATENLIAITLPEGYTASEFARIAANSLPDLDTEVFLSLARQNEGFLFPDTYYLPADFTAEELHRLLAETFQQKTSGLFVDLADVDLTRNEIITLASILEREANSEQSMKMVSGILQRRLQADMPLQADATMEYVLQKPLSQLTAEDLQIDTPYNTYLYRGLPPTPIGNPGLNAINAVLEPIKSDYLFYITDNDGNFHYAETFDEHRANIAKYLK